MRNIKFINTEYSFKVISSSHISLYQRPLSFFQWITGRGRREVELSSLELEVSELIPDIEPGDLLFLYPKGQKAKGGYYYISRVQEYLSGKQQVSVQAFTEFPAALISLKEMKGLIIQHPAL